MDFLRRLGDLLWTPWLLGAFLATGLYFSLRTGFFQIFEGPLWLKTTLGSLLKKRGDGGKGQGSGLTQLQALSTALASTIGTGSIAGVATAIFYGGPGAVFWMWVSALLGMMTGCVEKILAVRYRERLPGGGFQGGPMSYMEKGLHSRFLAVFFSLSCLGASLGGGNMVQANSIASALSSTLGLDPLPVGVVTAALTGAVILGGVGRIGRVSEKLVPAMALLYLGGGAAVLLCHAGALPSALESILREAFTPPAAMGGALGYGIMTAMRYGVARGVFTNEAGVGSSAMAHAASQAEESARQGMWGIFEVFVATLVICTVTALTILTSGVYSPADALRSIEEGRVEASMLGAPLSGQAFSTVLGPWGKGLVALCLMLFAFTSLLGWSYYGERALGCLTGGEGWKWAYRAVFLTMTVVGSVADVTAVWLLADIFNGLMALPNLCALLLLSPEALRCLERWRGRQRGT